MLTLLFSSFLQRRKRSSFASGAWHTEIEQQAQIQKIVEDDAEGEHREKAMVTTQVNGGAIENTYMEESNDDDAEEAAPAHWNNTARHWSDAEHTLEQAAAAVAVIESQGECKIEQSDDVGNDDDPDRERDQKLEPKRARAKIAMDPNGDREYFFL